MADQLKLLALLKNQFGLDASLNKDKTYYRIRINTDSSKRFKQMIGPLVLSTMRYKLDDDPVTTDPKGEILQSVG